MSKHHYDAGREIDDLRHQRDWPFYGLIQAAMRGADTRNQNKLKAAFPDVWEDLWARYEAPAGVLPTDPTYPNEGHDLVWGMHGDMDRVDCTCGWSAISRGTDSRDYSLNYRANIHLATEPAYKEAGQSDES